MTYEDAVDRYWQREMRAGRPRVRICQPSKALSHKTRNGWKLYNVRGFLGIVSEGKK